MTSLPVAEARGILADLVQRAAGSRQRSTITADGGPAAVLIGAEELADIEEAASVAEYRVARAEGTFMGVVHREALLKLGLPLA